MYSVGTPYGGLFLSDEFLQLEPVCLGKLLFWRVYFFVHRSGYIRGETFETERGASVRSLPSHQRTALGSLGHPPLGSSAAPKANTKKTEKLQLDKSKRLSRLFSPQDSQPRSRRRPGKVYTDSKIGLLIAEGTFWRALSPFRAVDLDLQIAITSFLKCALLSRDKA